MGTVKRNSLVFGGLIAAVCLSFAGHVHTVSAAAQGVTLTPATLTLTLEAGQAQTQSNFTITNHYATPISLHFGFAQPVRTPGTASAIEELSIAPSDLTIAGGASDSPMVTLSDATALAPGSQQVDLTITQQAGSNGTVSVVASIHMPLIVIKEAGAVTALSISAVQRSTTFILPTSIPTTVRNTGNVITIPRGYITISDPHGRTVKKGVMNIGSIGTSPGATITLHTTLTTLYRAWLPGTYRINVSYGAGGNNTTKTLSATFFYLPIWELLLLIPLGALLYCCYLIWMEGAARHAFRKKPPTTQARSVTPKKRGAK